jgi:hypothetical protein
MKYLEIIKELEYWKSISDEEDPEIVVVYDDEPFEIAFIGPSEGLDNEQAIGLTV